MRQMGKRAVQETGNLVRSHSARFLVASDLIPGGSSSDSDFVPRLQVLPNHWQLLRDICAGGV